MKKQYSNENIIILESALYRTTTSIIIGKDYIMLIDPNWLPYEIDYINKEIEKLQEGKSLYLVFTHSDYDHIIGYGKFKPSKTIASDYFVNNSNKEKAIHSIKTFDDEHYITRDYEISYPEINIEISVDRQELTIGSDTYIFYRTPGHTKDSLTIYNKTKGILAVGDYLSNIEFPFIYHNSEAYSKTLETLNAIINLEDVKMLIPGHGDYTINKDEMKHRIKVSINYIDTLKESISKNREYDITNFLEQYKYPLGLRKSHDENVKLFKTELKN